MDSINHPDLSPQPRRSVRFSNDVNVIILKGEKDENYVLIDLSIAEREYDITTGSFKNIDPSWNRWVFCKD